MDSRGRVTRKAEWVPGHRYQWLKGKKPGEIVTCLEFNERECCVLLEHADGHRSTIYAWSNRFRPFDELAKE